jgi:hypothetical protein
MLALLGRQAALFSDAGGVAAAPMALTASSPAAPVGGGPLGAEGSASGPALAQRSAKHSGCPRRTSGSMHGEKNTRVDDMWDPHVILC